MTSPQALPEDQISALRTDLLDWFDAHKRDLPWRKNADPYAIWVSEIMLQQTQVITVKDYYTRWMAAFPDVEALASADLDVVLAMWAGLGYYRRARSLHAAAAMVVEDFDGDLPSTVKDLKSLPGIGDYTAGAIASIAHGQVAALVDGNVERVFARLFAIPGDPKVRANQKRFWAIAHALVDTTRPGDFNQSLMELGATVCTPKSPTCLLCPVRKQCVGLATGNPTTFPAKVKRKKAKLVQIDALVLLERPKDGPERVVLLKRPDTGLLPGMLEAPSSAPIPREKPHDTHAGTTRLRQVLITHGVIVPPDAFERVRELGAVEHVFSHLKMRMHAHLIEFEQFPEPLIQSVEALPGACIVARGALDECALSAAQHKVFALVDAQG